MIDSFALVQLYADLALDIFAIHEDGSFVGIALLILNSPVLTVFYFLYLYVYFARS